MDPNAALARILENARSLNADRAGGTNSSAADQAEIGMELAEDVVNLSEWLAGGGFLPEAWRASQKRMTKLAIIDELQDQARYLRMELKPASADRLQRRVKQLGGEL